MRILIEREAILLRQIFSRKFNSRLLDAILSHLLFDAIFGHSLPLMYVIGPNVPNKNVSAEELEKDKFRVRDMIINKVDISYYSKIGQ